MRQLRLAVLALAVTAALGAAEIPKGTRLLLRMENTISTRTAREGDSIFFTTASPIASGGTMVVPVGSYVQGVVTHAERSGRVKGRAELGIRLESLTFQSGRMVRLSPKIVAADEAGAGQQVEQEMIRPAATKGKDAGQIAIFAGSGASLGALVDRSVQGAGIGGAAGAAVGLASVMLMRGREAELRRGATLEVVFDRAVTVE